MQLLNIAYQWLVSIQENKRAEERLQKIAKLSPKEKECYDNIVARLLKLSEPQVDLPGLTPPYSNKRQIYGIIFHQSKSWRDVEDRLHSLKLKASKRLDIIQEADGWLQTIAKLRSLQHQIQDYTKKLRNSANKTQLRQAIQDCKKTIHSILGGMEDYLGTLGQSGTGYQAYQEVIDFLRNNWSYLKVFANCSHISIDKEKLCAEVRLFNNKKHPDQIGQEQDLLTEALPAIFMIEELEPKEDSIEYEKLEPGTIYYPQGFSLQKSYFAPFLISAEPPAIKITKELLLGVQFPEEKSIENSPRPTKKAPVLTSSAEELEQIVEFALQTVNQQIKTRNQKGIFI